MQQVGERLRQASAVGATATSGDITFDVLTVWEDIRIRISPPEGFAVAGAQSNPVDVALLQGLTTVTFDSTTGEILASVRGEGQSKRKGVLLGGLAGGTNPLKPLASLSFGGAGERKGTTTIFRPDPEVFDTTEFSFDVLPSTPTEGGAS